MERGRGWLWTGWIVGAVVVGLFPWIDRSPYHVHLVILFALWLALGQAWNILGGFAGQVSFGHAAFFGVGAYATSLLYTRHQVPLEVGALIGAAVAAAIAVPVGLVCFRLRGAYFALTMLGMAEIFRLVAINWRSFTGGPVGILFPPIFRNKLPFYYAAVGLAGLALAVSWCVLHSRLGHRMRAVREDEEAASAIGIAATGVKLQALAISACLTGLLGGFFAPYQGYIDPDIVFSLADVSIGMIVVAVLGGIGTVWGPPIGAIVVTILSEVLRSTLGGAHLLVYAGLLVAIVRYLPQGLVGLILRARAGGVSHAEGGTAVHALQGPALGGTRARASPDRSYAGPVPALAATRAWAAPAPTDGRRADRSLLEVRGVTKTFGGLVALKDVEMEVWPGEVVGLIGPNGAGKTTLLSVISGFYRPDSGRVVFDGHDITGLAPHRVVKLGLARTFQLVRPLTGMTVWENVATAALMRGYSLPEARERAEQILRLLELHPRRHVYAGSLTLGERKLLELARALATEPSLLLLDEVAAGLASVEQRHLVEVLSRIRAAGVTLVLVEHVMQVVMSVADRLVVLHYGQVLAQGTPGEVARNRQVIEAYLGESEVESRA